MADWESAESVSDVMLKRRGASVGHLLLPFLFFLRAHSRDYVYVSQGLRARLQSN